MSVDIISDMIIDILIILGLIALIYIINSQKGKRFAISLLLSLYISVLITKYLLIDTGYASGNMLSISYIVVLIISYIAIHKYVRNHKSEPGSGKTGNTAVSVATTLMLLTTYFYFLPETVWTFSASIRDLFFYSSSTIGILFTIPIIALLISSKSD